MRYHEESFIADFGVVFQNQLLSGVHIRPNRAGTDLQKIGVLPPIPQLYEASHISEKTTVAISHLHLDHMGLLQYVHPHIPIFMSEKSVELYSHLHQIGEEPKMPHEAQLRGIPTGQPIRISEHLELELIPVNHDIPGAVAMHIRTPDATILYSGDVRLHEADQWTHQLLQRDIAPDILLIETTNVQAESIADNPYIKSEADELIPALLILHAPVVFNVYHRNIDRLAILIEAARQRGQLIVFEPETAYLVEAYQLNAPHVRYIQGAYDTAMIEQVQQIQPMTLEEIHSHFSSIWLQCSYHRMMTLLDLPVQGAVYVHSNGVPLGSYDPLYEGLLQWVDFLDMKLVQIGLSGHASAVQIQQIADAIDAKVTIPLHGLSPELLRGPNRTFLPTLGVSYPISQLLRETKVK